MIPKWFHRFTIISLTLIAIACNSRSQDVVEDFADLGNDQQPNPQQTPVDLNESLGQHYELTYRLILQTDHPVEDDKNFLIPFSENFIVPVLITPHGNISVFARDFPRHVFRLCQKSSNLDNCGIHDDTVEADVDIVLDVCGFGVPDRMCGIGGEIDDPTILTGSLTSKGDLVLNNVQFRIRSFLISPDLDGFKANDQVPGFVDPVRTLVSLTTSSINTGLITATGSPLNRSVIKLVAGNILDTTSEGFPLNEAHFTVTLFGQFNSDIVLEQ